LRCGSSGDDAIGCGRLGVPGYTQRVDLRFCGYGVLVNFWASGGDIRMRHSLLYTRAFLGQ
jgi:hypothetical protein